MRISMQLWRLSLLTAVFAFSAVSASAQATRSSASLRIGGIEVSLGDAQDQVLRDLSSVYDVKPMDGSPGTWFVTSRTGPPFRSFGSVQFSGRRLDFASSDWGPDTDDQSATSLALALFKALQEVPAAERSRCTLQPTGDAKTFHRTRIRCGDHELTIVGSHDSRYAAGVSQSIQSRP
jgi:hypothetical protein